MKIRLGVNLLCIQPGRNGGVETYVREILWHMRSDSEMELVLFTNHVNHQSFAEYGNVECILCPVHGSRRLLRVAYEQMLLSAKARKHGCQVLFCPGYLSPIFPMLPAVVAIHDMNFRDVPASLTPFARLLHELVIPRASHRADAVITISEFSRGRILQELGLNPQKIHVTHLAARTFETATAISADSLYRRSLPEHFMLCVSGSSPPHKNIMRLCSAFRRARAAFASPWELVCIGPKPTMLASLGLGNGHDGIHFLGYVENGELAKIYRRAEGFVLPSLYEGFGLPTLEAMYAGLPVTCSNAASLPEVVGEAALLFDPRSEDSIADALVCFVNDPALRQRLILAGASNLKRFSWQKCAEATARVCKDLIDDKGV